MVTGRSARDAERRSWGLPTPRGEPVCSQPRAAVCVAVSWSGVRCTRTKFASSIARWMPRSQRRCRKLEKCDLARNADAGVRRAPLPANANAFPRPEADVRCEQETHLEFPPPGERESFV